MSVEVWCKADGFACAYGGLSQLVFDGDGRVIGLGGEPVGPLIVLINPGDYPEWVQSWNHYPNITLRVDGNRLLLDAANGSWIWLLEHAERRQPWLSARWPESLGRLMIGRWPD